MADREQTTRERELQVRQLERVSTALIDFGVQTVRKNPIPSGMYLIGILVCLFFSGFTPNLQQQQKYEETLQTLDPTDLENAETIWYRADASYRRSKGWFTCDKRCQQNKDAAQLARVVYDKLLGQQENVVRDAKSSLGLFSTYGVDETRELFWKRFAQGRGRRGCQVWCGVR